jgi:acetyltransferase
MLEQDAFRRLHEAGVPMVSLEEVASPERLLSVCKAFGYPVVLKGLLPGVVHKADRQLVHTDVWGDDEALATWKSLSDAVAAEQGVVVVQPQIRRALAEVIVSTTDDPVYGLHVMVGGGGAAVEGNSDVAWLRAPINPAAARALLQRTRVGKKLLHKQPHLLEESRLPAVIAGESQLAADWRESVSEIEINPLIVGSDEIVAVDAVITMRSTTKGTDK